MLELINLKKTFNRGTANEKVALDGLNLHLKEGDFVTVIGSNGSGKSSMQNAICGVWRPDFGRVVLNGSDITALSEHRRARYLARVFQDPMQGTAADMQLEENLALAARRGQRRTLRWGITKREREQYRAMLSELNLGLEDRLFEKVGLLSGGQRQAITLMMAAIKQPQLLLLDEHTAALDPKTAATVLDITQRIVNKSGLTTLMITHNMRDAIAFGNRLIMLHEGRIVADVSGEQKQGLTISNLLELFATVGGDIATDRGMLA